MRLQHRIVSLDIIYWQIKSGCSKMGLNGRRKNCTVVKYFENCCTSYCCCANSSSERKDLLAFTLKDHEQYWSLKASHMKVDGNGRTRSVGLRTLFDQSILSAQVGDSCDVHNDDLSFIELFISAVGCTAPFAMSYVLLQRSLSITLQFLAIL